MRRKGERPAIRAGDCLKRSLPPAMVAGIRLASLAEGWADLAGTLGRRSRPLRLEKGELVVLAETPAVAQQLRMRGGDLCRKIREKWNLQVQAIRPIVGKGRPSPSSRKAAVPRRLPSIVVGQNEVQEALEEIRGTIGREDILFSLARLMATYRKRFGGPGKRNKRSDT